MLIKVWVYSWTHLRAMLFTLFLGSAILQILLYQERATLHSAYTPVTEDGLYCQSPNIVDFQHHGHGQVSIKFTGVNELQVDSPAYQQTLAVRHEGSALQLDLTLAEGFNSIPLLLDGKRRQWNAMYTSPNTYAKSGNARGNYTIGVIGLYPSDVCLGQPVIPITRWSPTDNADNADNARNYNPLWEKVFVEAIQQLEDVRGIPDSATEEADLKTLVQRLEQKTSLGWCSQIAMYSVAKLDGEIPVRLGAIGSIYQNSASVFLGGHTFLEYFDQRTQRWALSDPTAYILSIHDNRQLPLNTLEFSRIMSLNNPDFLNMLQFSVLDPKTGTISTHNFASLDVATQRDLKFYFRTENQITYFAGSSSVYSKSNVGRLWDWITLNQRFILSSQRKAFSVAEIRVFTFWLAFLSLIALMVAETYWRLFLRKRAIA